MKRLILAAFLAVTLLTPMIGCNDGADGGGAGGDEAASSNTTAE